MSDKLKQLMPALNDSNTSLQEVKQRLTSEILTEILDNWDYLPEKLQRGVATTLLRYGDSQV